MKNKYYKTKEEKDKEKLRLVKKIQRLMKKRLLEWKLDELDTQLTFELNHLNKKGVLE